MSCETSIPQINLKERAAVVASRCMDAYSVYRYKSWPMVAFVLLKYGLTEREAEAVMRSKHARWAADQHGARYGHVPACAIYTQMQSMSKNELKEEIAELVGQTFPEEKAEPTMNLKARAEAAYRAKLDREQADEARKEFDRRTAHVERLRGLCTTILQLSDPPFIRWCNIPGCGNEERERKPVACIDGFCFTCDAVQQEDYICLITFLPRGYNAQWIYTLSDLGEKLKKTHAVLGHMVGDSIIPLERRSTMQIPKRSEVYVNTRGSLTSIQKQAASREFAWFCFNDRVLETVTGRLACSVQDLLPDDEPSEQQIAETEAQMGSIGEAADQHGARSTAWSDTGLRFTESTI